MKYLLICTLLASVSCKQEVSKPQTPSANETQTQSDLLTSKKTPGTYLGDQLVVTVPTGNNPATAQALLYLPSEYDSQPAKRYPIIIHLAGIGQQTGNINDMITDGLCQRIANGLRPQAVNPVDGKKYKFIVFSPQGPAGSWGWQASQVMSTMLPSLLKTYRIDTTRIYVTGYSAGGWGNVTFMDDAVNTVKKIAAVCPVAPASIDNAANLVWAAQYGLATWNIVGGLDAFLPNSQLINNTINAASPKIASKITIIPNIGHSSWNQAYDPTWYDPADSKKLNLYQWFLQYKRSY